MAAASKSHYGRAMNDLLNFNGATSNEPHNAPKEHANVKPLAELLRPRDLSEVIGQSHLTDADNGLLYKLQKQSPLPSLILWGPPGCGKTTIARLFVTDSEDYRFEQISAIFSGVSDLRALFDSARNRQRNGVHTVLFVDEIHRFNKAQLDAFLPVLEDGTLTLIGATTENPSFSLNAALLSRCSVLALNRLDQDALEALLSKTEAHLELSLNIDEEARQALVDAADGDGRYLLGAIEKIAAYDREAPLGRKDLLELINRRAPLYDKSDEGHYNLISALHKSIRGSDPDAALYWLARMLQGGEDPRFIARRLCRMASEDIGLADPQALVQCNAAWESFERLGSPEGDLALAQAAVYLACAPKSNGVYAAFKTSMAFAKKSGAHMPPKHILNAPTKLMKDQDYGTGYIYDHDTPEGFSGQDYFPETLGRQNFYDPPERGFERDIKKRLSYWSKLCDEKA